MRQLITIAVCMLSALAMAGADDVRSASWHSVALHMPDDWYASDDAADIAATVMAFQMDNGGWPKNIDFNHTDAMQKRAEIDPSGVGSTIDNDATTTEIRYLARVYAATGDQGCYQAMLRGIRYVLDAQMDNGGWPQFWPVRPGHTVAYSGYITYNDDAMVNVLRMLSDIARSKREFKGLEVDQQVRDLCTQAFDRGIECILDTQIVIDGEPTVWCAQHDPVTLAPANARAYELASFSGSESAQIVDLLMTIKHPSQRIIAAVDGAIKWFEAHAINDKAYEFYDTEDGQRSSRLIDAPGERVWARFYDLDTQVPMFCDRDGIKRYDLQEVGLERRGGYCWYVSNPERSIQRYRQWRASL